MLVKKTIQKMVSLAGLTRNGFMSGDISTIMSPRTVITWAENAEILGDVSLSFNLSFLNKCDDIERDIVEEYFQRCFDANLGDIVKVSEAS
jgi:cobaltochelatase CobS